MAKFLIVDDDTSVHTILGNWVKEMGSVEVASNGKEALRKYHKSIKDDSPFTLAIIDLSMPELSGRETIVHIRQFEEACDIFEYLKVIVLTADNDKSQIMDLFKIGCEHYVTKPLKKDAFFEILGKMRIR